MGWSESIGARTAPLGSFLRRAHLLRPMRWAFLAAVATMAVMLTVPNRYASRATILPSDSGGDSMGGLKAAAAALGAGGGGGGNADQNFEEIIQSRRMAEFLLDKVYAFHQAGWAFGKPQPRQQTLAQYLHKPNRDLAVAALSKVITVNRDLKSGLLTVSVETESPELSLQVVRHILAELEDIVIHQNQTRGGNKAAFEEQRLKEARREEAQAEAALRTFAFANRNYQMSSDPAVRIAGSRLEGELQLHRSLVATVANNLENALMDAKNDTPVLNVLDNGNLPIEKSWPHRGVMAVMIGLMVLVVGWMFEARDFLAEAFSGGLSKVRG